MIPDEELYTLEELLERIDRIYLEEDESINLLKALYSLTVEIKHLKDKIDSYDL